MYLSAPFCPVIMPYNIVYSVGLAFEDVANTIYLSKTNRRLPSRLAERRAETPAKVSELLLRNASAVAKGSIIEPSKMARIVRKWPGKLK